MYEKQNDKIMGPYFVVIYDELFLSLNISHKAWVLRADVFYPIQTIKLML